MRLLRITCGVTGVALCPGGTGVPPVDGQDARPTNRTAIRSASRAERRTGFRISHGMTDGVGSVRVGSLILQHATPAPPES